MPKLSPLIAALQAGAIAREHWMRLSSEDRATVRRLIAKSKGLPKNLTIKERNEVRRILAGLDAKGAAWKLAPVGKKLRSGKKR
ncbi:MAG: hypothetical protein JWN65_1885 [Solirubrobacterales bacterium]|nr:hypothetical protein [Solirubrobacterales bacterium]